MRPALLALAVASSLAPSLAACGEDGGAGVGDACSLTATCADGAVCDHTSPGGPVCVDAATDDDGDGLPAATDFCQHQAGGRYDEDQDGVGDDCDRCPIAAPPITPDPDGDEVDAPCDPDATIGGDRIVAFTGFNEPGIPAAFRVSTASAWEVRGGEIIVTAGPTGLETLTTALPLSSNHMAVLARYRVDAVDTTASENAASVIGIDRRPAGTSVVSCGASRSGGTDRLLLDTDLANEADPFLTPLFDPASLYRLAARVTNASAACVMIANDETGAVTTSTTGQAMTEAGVSARGATVRFSYVLAIQRGAVATP